jgi:hypothetical protein
MDCEYKTDEKISPLPSLGFGYWLSFVFIFLTRVTWLNVDCVSGMKSEVSFAEDQYPVLGCDESKPPTEDSVVFKMLGLVKPLELVHTVFSFFFSFVLLL